MDVRKFIDLHVHIGPEPIPRKFTLQSLLAEESGKIAGFALKNHFYPTPPIVRTVEVPDSVDVIGSIVLNNYVGGLNPEAIRAAAELSEKPIIVWFPTINARNFLMKSEYEVRPEWSEGRTIPRLSKDVKCVNVCTGKKLSGAAKTVLAAIADNGCTLATGHLSCSETELLVEEAIDLGIERIILTHPLYPLIDMPIDLQRRLTKAKGIYVEHSYSMYLIDGISIGKIAESIIRVGPSKCILTSDMGQVGNPSPSVALADFSRLLLGEGISSSAIRLMGITNPRFLSV